MMLIPSPYGEAPESLDAGIGQVAGRFRDGLLMDLLCGELRCAP
jgi:hypothetical protein